MKKSSPSGRNFEPIRPLPQNNKYKTWGEFIKSSLRSYFIKLLDKDYYFEIKDFKAETTIVAYSGDIKNHHKNKVVFWNC